MLSEDLFTLLCLDEKNCNSMISSVRPTVFYNPSVLNIHSIEEVEEKMKHQLNLDIWTPFSKYIENNAALICIGTVAFQMLLFLMTIVDFLTANNEENPLLVFIRLIITLFVRMVNCFCKLNFIAARNTLPPKTGRYNSNRNYQEGVELEALNEPPIFTDSQKVFTNLENLA